MVIEQNLLVASVVLIGTIFLAFANGTNDVSKTVSTLIGSGRCNPRKGIFLGAIFNCIGCLMAILISGGIIHLFTSGLINPMPHNLIFSVAIVYAAIAWVMISTFTGMPVSTTHSIVGAMVIFAIFMQPDAVKWFTVFRSVLIPLAISPVILFSLSFVICRFVKESSSKVSSTNSHLSKIHWISSVSASLTRGLNDAPKIAALALLTNFTILPTSWILIAVALVMAAGGMYAGYRVTNTLAFKIVPIDEVGGVIANILTSISVGTISSFGLPLSTTHVSTGAIIGLMSRSSRNTVATKALRNIFLSWGLTLPISGILAVTIYFIIKIFS